MNASFKLSAPPRRFFCWQLNTLTTKQNWTLNKLRERLIDSCTELLYYERILGDMDKSQSISEYRAKWVGSQFEEAIDSSPPFNGSHNTRNNCLTQTCQHSCDGNREWGDVKPLGIRVTCDQTLSVREATRHSRLCRRTFFRGQPHDAWNMADHGSYTASLCDCHLPCRRSREALQCIAADCITEPRL